jgi:cell wall-associated NlpC family hydrolase
MGLAEIALLYLPMSIPYVWGGNNIQTGVDCSGFVCEISRAAGKLDKRDLNSQGLFEYFSVNGSGSGIEKNSVLFFGKDVNNIVHVSIAVNRTHMIEAGGEGRENNNEGYVRIRPISWRKDLVAALKVK